MKALMYCPKCERTIKKERLEEIDRNLRERFNLDSLSRGICPVCGCQLIDLSKKEGLPAD